MVLNMETLDNQEFAIRTFQDKIEYMVSHQQYSYIEAICEFCKQNNIEDPGSISSKIPKIIKEKVEAEANERNLLKEKVTGLEDFFR